MDMYITGHMMGRLTSSCWPWHAVTVRASRAVCALFVDALCVGPAAVAQCPRSVLQSLPSHPPVTSVEPPTSPVAGELLSPDKP